MKCSVIAISLLVTLAAGKTQFDWQIFNRLYNSSSRFLVIYQHKGAPKYVSERIAGGSIAVDGEFPYIASIQVGRRHICSGFIYNDKWIVTTASCVNG